MLNIRELGILTKAITFEGSKGKYCLEEFEKTKNIKRYWQKVNSMMGREINHALIKKMVEGSETTDKLAIAEKFNSFKSFLTIQNIRPWSYMPWSWNAYIIIQLFSIPSPSFLVPTTADYSPVRFQPPSDSLSFVPSPADNPMSW